MKSSRPFLRDEQPYINLCIRKYYHKLIKIKKSGIRRFVIRNLFIYNQ